MKEKKKIFQRKVVERSVPLRAPAIFLLYEYSLPSNPLLCKKISGQGVLQEYQFR